MSERLNNAILKETGTVAETEKSNAYQSYHYFC